MGFEDSIKQALDKNNKINRGADAMRDAKIVDSNMDRNMGYRYAWTDSYLDNDETWLEEYEKSTFLDTFKSVIDGKSTLKEYIEENIPGGVLQLSLAE